MRYLRGFIGKNLLFLLCCISCYAQNSKANLIGTGDEAIISNPAEHKTSFLENDRIWLNLHNDQGAFSQILIGFIEGATLGFDRDYDGPRFIGPNPVAFYSIVDDLKLAIQGRPPRSSEEEVIPLGIYSTIEEEVNLLISIDELTGELPDPSIEIIIADKELDLQHDLKGSSYSFDLDMTGTLDDRFDLIIKESEVLDIDDPGYKDSFSITSIGNEIFVKSKNQKALLFMVYDFLGRKLVKMVPDRSEFSVVLNNDQTRGVLLVTVLLENGQFRSIKILLHN